MLACDRCGASFSPIRVGAAADCPRCRAREGVSVSLTLSLFDVSVENVASTVDGAGNESSSAEVEGPE
jgi:uncharacterized OB-fold protein